VETGASSGGTSLAYTGSSPYVVWLAIAGAAVTLAGEAGRRRALSRRALLKALGTNADR
jgi:hypothetical protein